MNPLIVKGVVFGLLLACAALWDMKEREIPNLIPAMILVCGLIELRPAASVAGLLVTGGPYLLAALLTHGKTLAIGGGDIKLMGACGFVLGVWPGLLWHHAPFQCGFEGPDRSGTGESRGDSPWHLYHGGYG